MPAFYQTSPDTASLRTTVLEVTAVKKKPALSLAEDILYPGGGGQPCDTGTVTLGSGARVAVSRVLKINGKVYAVLAEDAAVTAGDEVTVEVDWPRRFLNMRYHTAAHVLMAVIKRAVTGYAASSIEIAPDGSKCDLRFDGSYDGNREQASKFVDEANAIIAEGRAVRVEEYETLEDGVTAHADIYRGPDAMKGRVSIVVIDRLDANPCGGTHLPNVADAGVITLVDTAPGRVTFTLDARA